MTDNKTSVLIKSQIPEFIRDNPDYDNFVLFLEAYYEWLEQTNNVLDYSKNILTYKDIDNTTDEFLNYFYKEFLSYFPDEILVDKEKAIRLARDLYQTKGTTASFRLFFKVVFNVDVEFFFTKDSVLKTSSGNWYVAQYLSAITTDSSFFTALTNKGNYKVLGSTSKAIADIENIILDGPKIRIYVTNLIREFSSGETISIVDSSYRQVYVTKYDSLNNPYQFALQTTISGSINSVIVDPLSRGLLYQVGDPVVFYGGLKSPLTQNSAIAKVATVTSGSLQYLILLEQGYGYRATPNTIIKFDLNAGATSPVAEVPSVGLNTFYPANVIFLPSDTIGSIAANNIYIGNTTFSSGARPIGNSVYYFANNITANANTTLANAFSFSAFTTYPISVVNLISPGSNISKINSVKAQSLYNTKNVISSVEYTGGQADIENMGMLAPIVITSAGVGYTNNDIIQIVGGNGFGAYANVRVNSITGAINSVNYQFSPSDTAFSHPYPLGGMGYKNINLPVVQISSANVNASGAILTIPGVLGTGAKFSTITNYVGEIRTINVTYPGVDYTSKANVSLRIQDIIVTGLVPTNLPQKGDIVYQGGNYYTSQYKALVDSITLDNSVYTLRVYNYTTTPDSSLPLQIFGKNIPMNIASSYTSGRYVNGILTYGDGNAKANVKFVSSLTKLPGTYLDSKGQLSSFSVLQSSVYNNYTYELTVQKEVFKYAKLLKDLVHPSGMNFLGRYLLQSSNNINYIASEALYQGQTLTYYTGLEASTVSIYPDPNFKTLSNNILVYYNIGTDVDVNNFVFANSKIEFFTQNSYSIASEVASQFGFGTGFIANPYTTTDLLSEDIALWFEVPGLTDDLMANTARTPPYQDLLYNNIPITIAKDNVWTTFANVARVTANAGSNVINISSLTGSYNLINGGVYSNVAYPLKDIIQVGDSVLVRSDANTSNSKTVTQVDYANNLVIVSSNYTSNVSGANSYISVNRTYTSNTGSFVRILGPLGLNYIPYLSTEYANPGGDMNIITEDEFSILIG
jgi:hypothetical protein